MYQFDRDIDSAPSEIRLHYPVENLYYQEYPGRCVLCLPCLFMQGEEYKRDNKGEGIHSRDRIGNNWIQLYISKNITFLKV